jgi:hypothetical protein
MRWRLLNIRVFTLLPSPGAEEVLDQGIYSECEAESGEKCH